MELSLARELPSCELSTISTAARRSRQREESLPRIHAAISGRGVPGREGGAKAGGDSDAGGRRAGGPNTGPLAGGTEAADSIPQPFLSAGRGALHLVHSSLTPHTGSWCDPGGTRFTTSTGRSAVPGSNQRWPAFSPGRRDPRCEKAQPRGPDRTAAAAPGPAPPPRAPRCTAPSGSQGLHEFLLCWPPWPVSPLTLSPPCQSQPAGALRGGQEPFPDRALGL